jgi:hypothetical protein
MATNSERVAQADLEAAKTARRNKTTDPANMVMLPFGKMVDVREFCDAKPAFQDRDDIVRFEKILKPKSYEPDKFTYAWPLADSQETQARLRLGLYIKMKKSDLAAQGELVTHAGPEEDDVRWYQHILVKIPNEYADRMYKAPEAMALQRLARHEDWIREESARIGHGVGAEVTLEKKYGKEA